MSVFSEYLKGATRVIPMLFTKVVSATRRFTPFIIFKFLKTKNLLAPVAVAEKALILVR